MRLRHITAFLMLGALLGGASPPFAATQGKRSLSFVDGVEMPTLSDPQMSPDGSQVLFVMNKADWKSNRLIGHIFRINADGSSQTQVTFGERGESSPRWSPDGKTVAFVARRDADANNQIYLLDINGGEARRLTNHGTAPSDPTWAPDGKSLWFAASDAKSADEREKERVQDDVYAFDETTFTQRHLWVSDLQGKTTKITTGDFSVTAYDLGNDGTRVATVRAPSPLLEHSHLGELWISDADGGRASKLTTNHVLESNPALSPDNTTVAFTAFANEKFEPYYNDKVFVVPTAGGTPKSILAGASFEVQNVAWAADGKSLFLSANMGVHNELMRVDVATAQLTALTKGEHTIGNWRYSETAKIHIFTRNTPTRGSEVTVLPENGGTAPMRVTNVFEYVEQQFKVARQERITWKGADGQEIEGLLFYPVDYRAGQRYPLIVQTHGGPNDSDKFAFTTEAQVYAGKGYAVLRPNYRGSTGYGDVFLRDVVGGYFKQGHLDVMTGIDAVIAKGIADPDKLGKMGWSAGGHMTNKIVTFTDRFKAASSGAGVANWISMYAQSDFRDLRTPWFGGTPWQKNAPIDLFWNHSPLKDAANVKTPTIFLVGEQDPRVPMPQSVEMYRALKANGVPTKLYVAPREGHNWGELRHRLFQWQVQMEWFERWINDRVYVWERVPGDEKKQPPKTTTAGQ
jgi:dipeptidyl aminopeptidase/acylaminoacyl peptidase